MKRASMLVFYFIAIATHATEIKDTGQSIATTNLAVAGGKGAEEGATLAPGLGDFTGLKTDILIGDVEGVSLRINLALPAEKGAKPRPAFVFIHGGGLIKGNKNLLNKRLKRMASKGIVAASVMYRLAPEYRFPAAIEDVKAAIRFLKAHASEFHLDSKRIILSGTSAGAYLAVMAGVTGNAEGFSDLGLYKEEDESVRAVIAHAPPAADYSLTKYRRFALVKRFINTDMLDGEAALAALSPVTYLDENDPPFFLVHGTADEKIPVEMTREFVAQLEAIGHEFEYFEVEGGKHSLNASRPQKAAEVFKASMAFFNKYGFPDSL